MSFSGLTAAAWAGVSILLAATAFYLLVVLVGLLSPSSTLNRFIAADELGSVACVCMSRAQLVCDADSYFGHHSQDAFGAGRRPQPSWEAPAVQFQRELPRAVLRICNSDR